MKSLLLALGALALSVPVLPAQEANELPDLKYVIDGSVRWLRGVQDPQNGGWGNVETTATVLRALAEGPRAYRRADGPLIARPLAWLAEVQAPNGAFVEPGQLGDSLATTIATARALAAFPDEASAALLARAQTWLAAEHGIHVAAAQSAAPPRAEAEARARALLASRDEDGSWAQDPRATARAISELTTMLRALAPEAGPARTAVALPAFAAADREAALGAMRRGALFLVASAVEPGRFGAPGRPDAGLSAMALGALAALPAPRPAAVQEQLDAGLAWLASLQRPDGAITQGPLPNYVTSAAILALVAEGDERWRPTIERAQRFLVTLQADEGEGYSESDIHYGGIGYGNDERPDLSNLQMALDALAASGLDGEHEAFRRALKFLERTQNRSESNDVRLAEGEVVIRSGDDGGAAYMPGSSEAGMVTLADGTKVPRSYGSMTYALLKSYVFAGLAKDDPRVQAAWKWLREHWSLDINPGFEKAGDPLAAYNGLFYYFHTMARTLDLFGEERIVDGAGVAHDWRAELCGRLVSLQDPADGSWTNENSSRWWEGNPLLATSYAVLSLGEALPAD